MKNKKYMDTETGELVIGSILPIDINVNYKLTDLRQMDTYRRITEQGEELQKFNDSVGGKYTFTLRKRINQLFSNESFNDTERVGIMYLGSFVNYDGYLVTNNNILIDKKLMKKCIKIASNNNAFNNFYNKLIENRILTESKEGLKWDTKFSFKGKPQIHNNKIKECYKTYDQTLQQLYENNKPKQLAVVFRLLPYINKFTNELCRVIDKPTYPVNDLYSPSEVAELLGINDSMGKKNFVRRSLKIKVGDEYVFMVSKVGTVSKVTVNPKLVWMNSKAPDHTLINLFELASNK